MELYLILGIFLLLILLSLKLRNVNRRSVAETYGFEPVESPISKSLVELISIAGGIYISLTLALSFLKIDYSPMYQILGVEFDFLALLSIILAIFQPVLLFIYNKIKGK
ncbi:hypothetical protein SAMN02745227_01593 [Anaerobranca californiensis DSM 14826]|jgi:hypothetical protein|uniref:Uncharacterized protein n=1 Tax=Anaerobranca californiensis DSM 14826 TaxID=1120989 RepID=A0A1M6PY35_9FIRM|nr:hypothetical protein [Anaerobranca californiensis]SHK12822.1 hypothetical protein SAMN02745227_01593 [Anaerobranca californiensis DSM 14826]